MVVRKAIVAPDETSWNIIVGIFFQLIYQAYFFHISYICIQGFQRYTLLLISAFSF